MFNRTSTFSLIYQYVNPLRVPGASKFRSCVGSDKANVLAAAEMTAKHRQCAAKIESYWATLAQHGGKEGGKGHKGGKDEWRAYEDEAAAKVRHCKAGAECTHGQTIETGSKLVQLKCDAGCRLSYHSACWAGVQERLDSSEDESGRVPCPNPHRCSGHVRRVALKQGPKLLAVLMGEEDADGAAEVGDEPVDEGEESDYDAGEEGGADAAGGGGAGSDEPKRAGVLGVPARSLFRSERFQMGEDGLLIFLDTQRRMEQKAIKDAKRLEEAAANRAAAEQKKKEEAESHVGDASDASKDSKSKDSPQRAASKPKSFGFEVVLPLVSQPGEAPPPLPPTKSNLTTQLASQLAGNGSSASLKNAFSSLNMDDDASSVSSFGSAAGAAAVSRKPNPASSSAFHLQQRSVWHEGSNAFDEAEEEPQSLFPITVKKVKGRKGMRNNAHEDEEAQLRAALAASMADANGHGAKPAAVPLPKAAPPTVATALFGNKPPTAASAADFPGLPSAAAPAAAAASPRLVASTMSAAAPVFVPAASLAAAPAPAPAPVTASPMLHPAVPGGPGGLGMHAASVSRMRLEGEQPGSNEGEEAPGSSAVSSSSSSPALSSAGSGVGRADSPFALPSFNAPVRAVAMAMPGRALPMARAAPQPAAAAHSLAHVAPPTVPAPAAAVPAPAAASTRFLPASALGVAPSMPSPTTITPPATVAALSVTSPPFPMAPMPQSLPMAPMPQPQPVPQPQPAPAPAAAAPGGPTLTIIDSLATSDTPTNVLLLFNLPACMTIAALGQQFVMFGRVVVKAFFCVQTGLTGVIQYASADNAAVAMNAMRGRVYELSTERDGDVEMEHWTCQPVWGRSPMHIVRTTNTTMRCVAMTPM